MSTNEASVKVPLYLKFLFNCKMRFTYWRNEKLQRALLFPSEATEEAGEGVGNRDKSLTSQHEKTQYIKLKTDESRKSSLSMLFTNMEADTRIKALPWWRWGGTHTGELLYFVLHLLACLGRV